MGLKTIIFYTKVAVSLAAGLLAGILGIGGIAGIAFFIFMFFLSTAILLTLKRDLIFKLGFYKAYREGVGSSLIAFMLTWSIATSLMLNQPTLYVASTSFGPHPISFTNGTVVPSNLKPLNSTFNAVYVIKSSENKTWKVMLGVYSDYDGETTLELSRCSVTYIKSDNAVKLSSTISLETLNQSKFRWGIEFSKENSKVFMTYEGKKERLEEGEVITLELRGAASTYSVHISLFENHLKLEAGPISMEDNSLNLTGTPFSDTISFVVVEEEFIYAFEYYLYTSRTIGFEEEYLVLEKPP